MWRVQPLLWSDCLSTFPRRRIHAIIGELCFLCGPCLGVIKRTENIILSQLSFETPACQDVSLGADELRHKNYWVQFSWELKVWLRREDLVCAIVPRYLECVIQWDCYSSRAKIRCKETDSGDCNRLRGHKCLQQWTVKCGDSGSAVLLVITSV
jgi:hypothetical protein